MFSVTYPALQFTAATDPKVVVVKFMAPLDTVTESPQSEKYEKYILTIKDVFVPIFQDVHKIKTTAFSPFISIRDYAYILSCIIQSLTYIT